MLKTNTSLRAIFYSLAVAGLITACKKDKDPEPVQQSIRPAINYNLLTDNTPYTQLFVNAQGDSTVDRTEGQTRLSMFRALNDYMRKASGTGTAVLSETAMKNMFSNTNSPFIDSYTYLNSSSLQIKNVTASSKSAAEAADVRADIEGFMVELADASDSVTAVAAQGKAGKLGNYLVDERGIEWGQVIAKSLIGGFQVDYIGNVLLNTGLDADNYNLVAGKKYTQLEHNWDEAYGTLTFRPRYADSATATTSKELFLGSYVWEYNKAGFPKIHPAFLKGRAAIVNNDRNEVKAQANLIRTEFEKAIANAAIGYMVKTKNNTTDASSAHAFAEGLGFIYSLRFCSMHGADAQFSDNILNELLYTPVNGYWTIKNEPAKLDAAIAAIQTKFAL